MLKNNKGFTVVELIMSFLFSSILALSLFSVILSYRNKQVDSSIESRLIAFKSQLIMDIQKDIQLKGVKEIKAECPKTSKDEEEGLKYHPRCVIITYNGDPEESKELKIESDPKIDIIENEDGQNGQFSYSVPYIVYGDIRYDIPDAASVYIDDDYILHTTTAYDGLETGTALYNINFNLKHSDLDTDINISIVVNGTAKINTGEGSYKQYFIGDKVAIQLNEFYQQTFRVIQDSSKLNPNLVLMYDPDPEREADTCTVINDGYTIPKRVNTSSNPSQIPTIELYSVQYNAIGNYANKYNGSIIKTVIGEVEQAWNNADSIRLATTEDIARVAAFCPQYRGADSLDVSISSAPSWLTNKSYWTMSEKLLSGDDNGKKVWYVNGSSKILASSYVDESHVLRPVITISKDYVTDKCTDGENCFACGSNLTGATSPDRPDPEESGSGGSGTSGGAGTSSNIVCRSATTLHTKTCEKSGTTTCNGCNTTVGYGNTIVYGKIVTGYPKAGDAFDCDVNNDGTYDPATERFYYVKNKGDRSVLIYYANMNNQEGYAYDTSNENWHGPRSSYSYLPSKTEWSNPRLLAPGTRQIVAQNGASATSGGTIESFTYTNKAARLLTAQEVNTACGMSVGSSTRGELDNCTWLLENIEEYEKDSNTVMGSGYQLETPQSSSSIHGWFISGSCRFVQLFITNQNSTSVRPVIEVLNSSIEFDPSSVIVYPAGKNKATVVTGDIVTIDTEEFYVVKHDGDELVLLSHYNLNVGDYKKTDATEGIQDSDVKGWVASGRKYGNVEFSTTNYWNGKVGSIYPGNYCSSISGTNCAFVYDNNSYVYQYVNNYKAYLEAKGATIKSARLLKIEEAYELGCGQSGWNCNNAPAFVNETSYWLGSAVNSNNMWLVSSRTDNDNIGYGPGTTSTTYGIRPVIVI